MYFYFTLFFSKTDRGEQQRDRETGRYRLRSRLQALRCLTEPDAGLKPTKCEILTWAEVRHLSDWDPHTRWFFLYLIFKLPPLFYFLMFQIFIYLFLVERDRPCEQEKGSEGERERERERQHEWRRSRERGGRESKAGSALTTQSLTWGSIPGTMRSWPEPKSKARAQPTEPPR